MKLLLLVFPITLVFGSDTETSTVNEGETININCGTDSITINSGHYICKNDDRASDKTAILRGLCNDKTQCSVDANNGVFSDPFPGCGKEFTSEWQCNQRVEVDEGGQVNIDCGTGTINVLSAHYICKNDGRESDKTSYVSSACNDRNTCLYGANNGNMGDPYPGCGKKLRVIYNCTPDPCADKDCDDGNYCNGEEYCDDNGECQVSVNGDIQCPNAFVCTNLHNKCVRDCSTFAIDGFLRDCSAEYESTQNAISGLGDDIDDVNGRVDSEASRITANKGEIDDNKAGISSNKDEIDDIKAGIADCKERLDGFLPLPGADPAEAKENQSTVPFFYNNEYEIILGLIVVNIILMAIMLYQCCYERKSKKHSYERVVIYPSSDEQENKRLKQ